LFKPYVTPDYKNAVANLTNHYKALAAGESTEAE
jgi:hypothetical protein